MYHMKKLILVSAMLLSTISLFAQSSKTFTKTIPSTHLNVLTALPSNVIVKYTKGSRATISVTVTVNTNNQVLDAIGNTGRYEVDTKTLQLGEKSKKQISINGVDLEEDVKITIYLGTDLK